MAANQELVDRFTEFYRQYYPDEIGELARKYPKEQKSLSFDWKDLYRFDPDLAQDLQRHPDEIIDAAKEALRHYDLPIQVNLRGASVRVYGLQESTPVGELNSERINKFVSLRGSVDKSLPAESVVTEAIFTCQRCGAETVIPQKFTPNSEVQEPYQCTSCERNGPFELNIGRSSFVDRQKIELREAPVGNRTGNDLESVVAYLEGDIAGTVSLGDQVELTGIVRKLEPGEYTSASLSDKYIDTISVQDADPYTELRLDDADKEKILELSQADNIYERFVDSLAPTIYGYHEIKLALILQLFGGVQKLLPDGSRKRGNSHVLLVGDPGTAKSTLIKAVGNISPKALSTNGKRTTSAGLTTAATRTSGGTSAWELEAGPIILADQGVLAIDDLDQMDENVRADLLEPMEEQLVTSSKGDVNDVLKARTAISAAANPKYGRFDQYEPIGEQVDLSPSLISRFDLIFTVTDKPDSDEDSKIANHVLDANYVGEVNAQQSGNQPTEELTEKSDQFKRVIDIDLLRKYIAYARQNCNPAMTELAKESIEEFYVNTRSGGSDDTLVPITVRQIEAIVRLAEASARVRLSDEVTVEDAERVIDIIRNSLEDLGIDPESEEFDSDVIETGRSNDQRDRVKSIIDLVEKLVQDNERGAPIEELLTMCESQGIERSKAEHQIENLKQKGELYEPAAGYLRTT